MEFTSFQFFIFFIMTTGIFFVMPAKLKNGWLLFCSLLFYAAWNWKFTGLLAGTIIVTYVAARMAEEKKSVVPAAAGIAVSVGLLLYFKYTNFILTIPSVINPTVKPLHFDIILPLGISFYIFQIVAYLVDVYKGKATAERNLIDYALFVSFFPENYAGPH